MPNTFDWIEIRTGDIEKIAQFYENLFGWKITTKQNVDGFPVWLFETGGEPRMENLRRGGIWLRPADEPHGVIVYILVDDIDATLQKVVTLGGKVVGPKTPLGNAHRAYFSDPEGTLFGLWEE